MSVCRDCGAPLQWELTTGGKYRPLNPDGSLHFLSCSALPPKPMLPDHVCLSCGSLDVVQEPGRGPHYAGLRCNDCRAFRWLRKPVTEGQP